MLALLFLAQMSAETSTISARELSAQPLPYVVLTPAKAPKVVTLAVAREAIEDAFVPVTALDPRPEEDPALGDCNGVLECIWARVAPGGQYLLILTVQPSRDTQLDFISLVVSTAESAKPIFPEAHEKIASAMDLKVALARFVEEKLRPILAKKNLYAPWGRIVLRELPVGAVIELDGRGVGTARTNTVVIDQAPLGKHVLSIEAAGRDTYAREVEITTRSEHDLSLGTVFESQEGLPLAMWIGGGVAAAGLAATLAGIVATEVTVTCFDAETCTNQRFANIGSASSSAFADPNPAGISPFRTGVSLFSAGLSCALFSLFFDERDALAWLPYLAGVATGAATYLILGALESDVPAFRAN